MTKTIGGALTAHLASETTSKAKLIRISRLDGTVYAFTDHDRDITFSGVLYSAINSLDASSIESRAGLSVANLDFMSLIDSDQLSAGDLATGLFDFAAVEVREVNYEDLTQGAYYVRFGTLGEVSIQGALFKGELRGLAQYLQQTVGRIHQRRCDANLGDDRCAVDTYALTEYGTVVGVTDRATFAFTGINQADSYFDFGLLTWTTGLNTSFPMEVKHQTQSPQEMFLFLPEPHDIAVGDQFSVYPGCDKNLATCLAKFNNVANFRGFPDMPGRDQIVSYPDSPY